MVYLGPKCDSVIDHVNPWRVLVFDRTLQSIAYKLVPNLYKGLSNQNHQTMNNFFFLEEIERQIAYYKERDLPYPPSLVGKTFFRKKSSLIKEICIYFEKKKNYKKNGMKKNNK